MKCDRSEAFKSLCLHFHGSCMCFLNYYYYFWVYQITEYVTFQFKIICKAVQLVITLLLFVCHLFSVTLPVTLIFKCKLFWHNQCQPVRGTLLLPWRWWVAYWSPFLPVVWSPTERGRSESPCKNSSSVQTSTLFLQIVPAGCVVSPPARRALALCPLLLSFRPCRHLGDGFSSVSPGFHDRLSPVCSQLSGQTPWGGAGGAGGWVGQVLWSPCDTRTHTHKLKDIHTGTHNYTQTDAQKHSVDSLHQKFNSFSCLSHKKPTWRSKTQQSALKLM